MSEATKKIEELCQEIENLRKAFEKVAEKTEELDEQIETMPEKLESKEPEKPDASYKFLKGISEMVGEDPPNIPLGTYYTPSAKSFAELALKLSYKRAHSELSAFSSLLIESERLTSGSEKIIKIIEFINTTGNLYAAAILINRFLKYWNADSIVKRQITIYAESDIEQHQKNRRLGSMLFLADANFDKYKQYLDGLMFEDYGFAPMVAKIFSLNQRHLDAVYTLVSADKYDDARIHMDKFLENPKTLTEDKIRGLIPRHSEVEKMYTECGIPVPIILRAFVALRDTLTPQ